MPNIKAHTITAKHSLDGRSMFVGLSKDSKVEFTSPQANKNVKDTEYDKIEKAILKYIKEHDKFTLHEVVYNAISKIEPYRVRDIAHKIINPMVVKSILKVKWDNGYYYEKGN